MEGVVLVLELFWHYELTLDQPWDPLRAPRQRNLPTEQWHLRQEVEA